MQEKAWSPHQQTTAEAWPRHLICWQERNQHRSPVFVRLCAGCSGAVLSRKSLLPGPDKKRELLEEKETVLRKGYTSNMQASSTVQRTSLKERQQQQRI
jgi:hypothetical protein